MPKSLRIFVADRVPLANKGEEAIIRGIEDLLAENGQSVELGVFDRRRHPAHQGNIKVFPVSWTYPDWTTKFGPEPNRLLRALEAKRYRLLKHWRNGKQWLGVLGVLGNIARSTDPRHAEMRAFFDHAEMYDDVVASNSVASSFSLIA